MNIISHRSEVSSARNLRRGGMFVRRRLFALIWALALALLTLPVLPAAAQEPIDRLPQINSFGSARFDLLTTLEIGDAKAVSFGSGSTILPDRVSLWVGADGSDKLFYYVQVGTLVYTNDGSGWKRGDNLPPGSGQNVTLGEQLDLLQGVANAILDMGAEPVRGIPAEHYQMWVSGDRLLEISGNTGVLDDEVVDLINSSTYKVDLWIGKNDGQIYQQNVVLTFPEQEINKTTIPQTQLTSLITFYDLNDPSIKIEPPIQ